MEIELLVVVVIVLICAATLLGDRPHCHGYHHRDFSGCGCAFFLIFVAIAFFVISGILAYFA